MAIFGVAQHLHDHAGGDALHHEQRRAGVAESVEPPLFQAGTIELVMKVRRDSRPFKRNTLRSGEQETTFLPLRSCG